MEASKLQLKIFIAPESARALDLDAFIPVFHRWIKEHALPELLVDVANYVHVPEGPSVALIGHGSDYFIDAGGGRLGLLHNRKRAGLGPSERLDDLVRRTLHVAALLANDATLAGQLRFATGELLFRINDRLRGPNLDETFASVKGELEALASRLYRGPFELVRVGGPKELFGVRIVSPSSPPLLTLLERAGGAPAADGTLVAAG